MAGEAGRALKLGFNEAEAVRPLPTAVAAPAQAEGSEAPSARGPNPLPEPGRTDKEQTRRTSLIFKRDHQNGVLSQTSRYGAGRGRAVCREHGVVTAHGRAGRS